MHIPTDLDNIPTDPDQIYALLGQSVPEAVAGDEDPSAEPTPAKEETPPAAEAAAKEDAPAEADAQSDPASKLVPLSAVFSEREKTRALRERAAAAEARIAELEKAAEEGRPAVEGETSGFGTEELNEIEEAFPAIGKGLRAVQTRLERMEAENRELKSEKIGRERVAAEDAQTEAQQAIAEALAASPKLAHLDKTLTVETWNARVAPINDTLVADPEFSKLPIADRLAKVAEIYEYRYGPVTVPSTKGTTQQRAAEALKSAGVPEISTLSDIAGGTVPDSPERDIERMSVHDIAALDKDSLERLISKLA